jgi:hypothetical protein
MVIQEATRVASEAQQKGQFMDDRTAMDTAAKNIREKLQGYQAQTTQQAQAEAMKANALNFEVGMAGQAPRTAGSLSEVVQATKGDDAAFMKFHQQRLRAKGVSSAY